MPQEQQVVENLVKIQELSGALSQLLDQNQNTIKSLLDQSDWIKIKLTQPGLQLQPEAGAGSASAGVPLSTSSTVQAPASVPVSNSKQLAEMEQQIFALQRENAELHQTLEIVMSKFRHEQAQHQQDLIQLHRTHQQELDSERHSNEQLRYENLKLQAQVQDMLRVLKQAIQLDEQEELLAEQEDQLAAETEQASGEVDALMKQNETLKNMMAQTLAQQ